MPKVDFLFIATSFVLLPFMGIDQETLHPYILKACIFFISTFGIAHGAIDNHLYGVTNKKSNLKFIGLYVLAALGFGLIWLLSAQLALLSFLLVSAYHFGESQFADLKVKTPRKLLLNLSWGAWLLSAFIYLNTESLHNLDSTDILANLLRTFVSMSPFALMLSTLSLLGIFLSAFWNNELSLQRVSREAYEMVLIAVVFYLYQPLLGFSLYFVILHSLRVLNQEYEFLQGTNKIKDLLQFIKILSPFTLISIAGMLLFLGFIEVFSFPISLPLAALIFISCLTMPHALVMSRFYQQHKPV